MLPNRPLDDLQTGGDFLPRHIGPQPQQIDEMLATLDAKSLDALIDRVVPAKIRTRRPLALPAGKGERDALSRLRKIAGRNHVFSSMIGMGYYGTIMPKVILRPGSGKARAGTPPIRPIRRRSARAGWKHS